MITVLCVWLLAQVPSEESVPPPPVEEPAPVKPAPPKAPEHGPAPDAQDLTDAPRTVVIQAPRENTVVAFENDAPGFFTHAIVAALPAALLGAIPAAFLAGAMGIGVVVASTVFGPLLAFAPVLPVVAGLCLGPACCAASLGSCTASLTSQSFSSRKGALLPALGAAVGVTMLGLALVVFPVFVMSGVVGVATLLVPSSPVRSGWDIPDVSGRENATRTALIAFSVGHPILAGAWLLLGTALAAGAGGIASALAYRWSGRPKEAGEGSSVDILVVDPPPGANVDQPAPEPRRKKGRTRPASLAY